MDEERTGRTLFCDHHCKLQVEKLFTGHWRETAVTLANPQFSGMPLGILNIVNYENASVPKPESLMLLAIGLTGIWTTRQSKDNTGTRR